MTERLQSVPWGAARSALMSAADVAVLRGCAETTVRAALRDGTLRGRQVGRTWVISRHAAEAWTPRPVGWAPGRRRVSRSPSS